MRAFLALPLLALLSGCGYPYLGGTTAPSVSQTFSLDAVKQISPDIVGGDTPSAYGQAAYDLASEARLLFRYESFSTHVSNVNLENNKRVLVQVTVESDPSEARTRLKLCPLVSDWMMLATWTLAHPFGLGGQWKSPGADYDGSACESAQPVPVTPDLDYKPERLFFDMTQWFVDYARGRNVNYGWVLKASGTVRVVGDTSASNSPRVYFEKYLTY